MLTTDVCNFIALNEETTKFRKPNFRLLERIEADTNNFPQVYRANIEWLIVEEDIFQVRDLSNHWSGDAFESKYHVNSLRKPLLNKNRELEPITIGWGRVKRSKWGWLVIDGHHRIRAYLKAQRTHIPVVVFEGTAREMLLESIRANNQDKLSMTATDKLESAWTIWVSMIGVEKQFATVKTLGVSNGTLSNFKAAQEWYAKELESGEGFRSKDEVAASMLQGCLSNFTWKEARKLMLTANKAVEFDQEEQARAWSQALFERFGHKGKESPQVFFKAMRIYMGERKFLAQVEFHSKTLEVEDF